MRKTRSPLKGRILTGSILFIVLLCIVLGVVEYDTSKKIVYDQYEASMGNILNYVAADIDVDDLADCIRTGVASPKFQALQKELDKTKEPLSIHFIYIIIPLNAGERDNVQNVMAGATQYEYENEAEDIVRLNSLSGDAYSSQVAGQYLAAYQAGKLSFFVSKSAWGIDYTGLLPLVASNGEKTAALCLDIDIADINAMLRRNVLEVVGLIALIGVLFIVMFYIWTERKVTGPINSLAGSVDAFSARYRERKDPGSLTIDVSSIRTHNEVETLAYAVSQMGDTIREYAENAVKTERELKQIKANIADLSADLDSLTKEYSGEAGEKLSSEPHSYDIQELGRQITR